MENYSVVLFILVIMVGLSALAGRSKIPYPVLLILGGIIVGFIPSVARIKIDPEVIFLIFLPPLLHDAAFNISFKEFRTHLNTISTLAISLVFITATGIAITSYFLIPGMTWPLAFVLGAILSATDAVSAISVTKGLGLSHKTRTILEGESLVNDASALVAYRFAVAAVTGTAFVLWKATLEFFLLMGGGFLVGLLIGKLMMLILKRLHHNNLVAISLLLLMPFVTYLLAEELHVSGVIAVVVLGISTARISNKIFRDSLKKQSEAFWEVIIFLLNGLIFILIGMEFPYVLDAIPKAKLLPYTGYAFIIAMVALVLRIVRVFSQQIDLQRAFQKKKRRVSEQALLDFRTSLIISWSGMRGIVSLAMAIALPVTLENGKSFPMRDAISFISVSVVLFTIVLQGMSLPWLVKRLKPKA